MSTFADKGRGCTASGRNSGAPWNRRGPGRMKTEIPPHENVRLQAKYRLTSLFFDLLDGRWERQCRPQPAALPRRRRSGAQARPDFFSQGARLSSDRAPQTPAPKRALNTAGRMGLILLLLGAAPGARAADASLSKRRVKPASPPRAAIHAPDLNDDAHVLVPSRVFPQEVRQEPLKASPPAAVRWMIKPLRRGMFIRLPIVDSNPNRGVTVGVMPIWVFQGENDDRIKQIHAPSLTHNKHFGVNPTYRYYLYPKDDASLVVRGSLSKFEREAMGQYEDARLAGSDYDVFLRVQYGVNSSQRFFGFGPDAPRDAESNYREESAQYRFGVGAPFAHGSPWRVHLAQHYQSGRISEGPLPDLPNFSSAFPGQIARRYQQTTENRLSLDYDTRDHGVTTSRGAYIKAFSEYSIRGAASQFDYSRYGLDTRWFHPWESRKDAVFAFQARFEQVLGPPAPFWIQSRLGGKYSLRAYGEGRYIDRGAASINAEQRFKLLDMKAAGVTTEVQVAPFIGLGSVFSSPNRASVRYARPVFGTAFRAVARPQVVGSVDVGVGREGVAVFTDINYSF